MDGLLEYIHSTRLLRTGVGKMVQRDEGAAFFDQFLLTFLYNARANVFSAKEV